MRNLKQHVPGQRPPWNLSEQSGEKFHGRKRGGGREDAVLKTACSRTAPAVEFIGAKRREISRLERGDGKEHAELKTACSRTAPAVEFIGAKRREISRQE
ncbi:MAG: hypothetical protein K2O03_13485, partial [Lachnospiraceae bacterium]|nr:hypothetical protein [Lachnospiraceae bacterium]